MTKKRISRLIELSINRGMDCALMPTEEVVEFNDLLMEFQAWHPEAEISRLRAALRQHGRHDPLCDEVSRCVCGFDHALEGGE